MYERPNQICTVYQGIICCFREGSLLISRSIGIQLVIVKKNIYIYGSSTSCSSFSDVYDPCPGF